MIEPSYGRTRTCGSTKARSPLWMRLMVLWVASSRGTPSSTRHQSNCQWSSPSSIATLTGEQIHRFAEHGYLVVPGLVDEQDLDRADADLDHLLTDAPPPWGHVGRYFCWQRRAESPALFHLLGRLGGILDTAGEFVGPAGVDVAFDQAQVALNIGSYPHRPG